MKNPIITRALDASTVHITQEDAQNLDRGDAVACYTLDEYGWLVYVGEPESDLENYPGFSDAFLGLISSCREHGCEYLRLDKDGADYDDMPTFDW